MTLPHATTSQREQYAAVMASMAKHYRGRMRDYLTGAARIARGEWSYG